MSRLLQTKSVGDFIKTFRQEHDLTVRELAEKIDIDFRQLGDAESGRRAKPIAIIKRLFDLDEPLIEHTERIHLARMIFEAYAAEFAKLYEDKITEAAKELGVTVKEVLGE